MDITLSAQKIISEVKAKNPSVLVVAASKTQSIEKMKLAMQGGIEVFAENRAQEFVEKFGKIDCRWHFIGRLQTNKVKYVVGKVELIHSVDSVRLLDEIDKFAAKSNVIQRVLLEINIGREETKSGVFPEDFDKLYEYALSKTFVKVEGIMAVMPKNADRKLYLQLKEIYDRIKNNNDDIKFFSCGMSVDYALAIENGANVIRLGEKIFGKRDYSKER